MRDEVGEHMARDLRPSLHAVSLHPSDSEVNICRLGFSTSHRFSMGFRLGDCDGHGKNLYSAVGEPFFVLILRGASDRCPAGRSNHGPF